MKDSAGRSGVRAVGLLAVVLLASAGCQRRPAKERVYVPVASSASGQAMAAPPPASTPTPTFTPTPTPTTTPTTTTTPAPGMPSSRSRHTATTLANGDVLVVGGLQAPGQPSPTAEVYERYTGQFVPTASPPRHPRVGHTATLLPTGEVLIAGGHSDAAGQVLVDQAEFYDPAARSFRLGPRLLTPRSGHSAIPLGSNAAALFGGARPHVLIVGGVTGAASGPAARWATVAESYDPGPGVFDSLGTGLFESRRAAQAVALGYGTALIQGGLASLPGGPALTSTVEEVYEANRKQFAQVATTMTVQVEGNTLTALGGAALATGGRARGGAVQAAAHFYTQNTLGFVQLPSGLLSPRADHSATALQNGQVLVAGGTDGARVLASAELWAGSFRATLPLATARAHHTATTLQGGEVVVVGGEDAQGRPLASAELYNPTAGTWSAHPPGIAPAVPPIPPATTGPAGLGTPPAPQLRTLAPVTVRAGDVLRIEGQGFDLLPAQNLVAFQGASGVVRASNSIQHVPNPFSSVNLPPGTVVAIEVRVPAGATSGPVTVVVFNASGMSQPSNALPLTVQ